MLLRHTASALALATALVFNSTASPLASAVGVAGNPVPTHTESGRGPGSGAICAGCVAGGVMAIASGGWAGVWLTFMIGGAGAVGAGGAIVTCSVACAKFLSED